MSSSKRRGKYRRELAAYADHLQDALTAAIPGDQIWVAAGGYRPNSRFVDRGSLLSAFQIPDRVAMYGGFQGGETSVAQRDWQQHPTMLFGNGAYHVITTAAVSAATVLDGFTITGGSASGDIGPLTVGAGWQNDHGSPTIRNCIFENNYATGSGAGLNNTQGSPLLSHVVFRKNTAEASGGGMTNYGGTPILQDVVFQQNQVSNGIVGRGGGFANLGGGSATLVDVTFEGNTSASIGGGIANDAATLTISVATFQGNRGEVGGAIGHIGNGTLVISDATFLGNVAQMGGGVANLASKLSIHHATFQRNSASYAGGGVFVQYATDLNELHTLVFSGNYAHEGAGIAFEGSAGSVGNATFVGNRSWYGPALFGSYSALLVQNSIVWENEPLEGGQVNGVNIRYSLVQGGATGPGNTSADPRFVNGAGNDHRFGSDDDDLRLRAGSPAIDAGDASVLPATVTTDHAGAPRFVDDPTAPDIGLGSGPAIDMGAYEYQNVLPLPMPTELSVAPIRRAQITLHWQDNSADEQVFLDCDAPLLRTNGLGDHRPVGCSLRKLHRSPARATPPSTTASAQAMPWATPGLPTLAVTTRACEHNHHLCGSARGAGNMARIGRCLPGSAKRRSRSPSGDQICWRAAPTCRERSAPIALCCGQRLISTAGLFGGETALAQRDWQANATVLSGDIGILAPSTAMSSMC
ncbi:MAG: choice-of-anchor Q domain-containing protein [Kouleothrix sp.]